MDHLNNPDGTAVIPRPEVEPHDPIQPPAAPADRGRTRRRVTGALVVSTALVAGSFGLGRMAGSAEPAATPQQVEIPAPASPSGDATANEAEPVAAVAAALTPSMVQIETQQGLGSGVIYDSSGLILTAAHVVGDATSVIVQLADGTRVDGTVVGADEASDVAVVEIDAPDLVAAPLAIDEELVPGQMAIAIGSPFGLDQTVTAGVISSPARSITSRNGSVNALIQTDAPINPGNSGGALADRQGRVIGINDQIYSQSGGNEGVGFAIPITRAKAIADQLVTGEAIQPAFLGVTGADTRLGRAGAVITGVESGTPAATAGLQDGDLVVAIDGTPIESFADLAAIVRAQQPGDIVSLSVQRGDSVSDIDVVLGAG